jgi:hypothetical protein
MDVSNVMALMISSSSSRRKKEMKGRWTAMVFLSLKQPQDLRPTVYSKTCHSRATLAYVCAMPPGFVGPSAFASLTILSVILLASSPSLAILLALRAASPQVGLNLPKTGTVA